MPFHQNQKRPVQTSLIVFICASLLVLYGFFNDLNLLVGENKQDPVTFPIDIVYTWVNGSDPDWLDARNYWISQTPSVLNISINKARFQDHNELKYSLRSLYLNAPWIRSIFIVTNGQIPCWLKTSHPKIKMVFHSQIILKEALPTYNSHAIEANIFKIPSLSEHFLYANDDCFFNKKVRPEYFFERAGKPIIRMEKPDVAYANPSISVHEATLYYSYTIVRNHYNDVPKFTQTHNIVPYQKGLFTKCYEEFSEAFLRTTYFKFRSPNSISPSIVSYYTLAKHQGVLVPLSFFHKETNLLLEIEAPNILKYKALKSNPTLLCVNDWEGARDDDRSHVEEFFKWKWPEQAPWEL